MRAVVIGAGRGSRLGHHTDLVPKTLVEVMGRPMLDWILEALEAAGFPRKEVIFICGYAEDVVRRRYPDLDFVRNPAWADNNILLSLLCARPFLEQGFVATYADIVYTPDIARRVAHNPAHVVLGCDTAWRRRYVERSEHPESDAEKLRADGARVLELGRKVPSEAAQGEFIGVMKLSTGGAADFLRSFEEAERLFSGGEFREGRSFQKAYLIDLLQWMLERGTQMERENTAGGYMELDTRQDLSLAEHWWKTRPDVG